MDTGDICEKCLMLEREMCIFFQLKKQTEPKYRTRYTEQATRLTFESRCRQESFLFSETSIPALGPTQPHIQWVMVSLSRGKSGWGMYLTPHLHWETRLRINGAIPLLPYMRLWHELGLHHRCVISGSNRGVHNVVALSWWYIMSSLFRDGTQSRLVISYRCFGTSYRSHLQRPRWDR